MTIVEIALDDVAGARAAEWAGADRIELCAGLSEGGTTPSAGLLHTVVSQVSAVTIMVLIRPRPGDFVYSRDEVDVMLADIDILRRIAPAAGFVIGALLPDGMIDSATTRELVKACGTAPVSFHKAFDGTRDLFRSLDTLLDLGIPRVLTSGGCRSASAGAGMLRALVERSEGRIAVMAGGGVRPGNVASLVADTGVQEVHLRAAVPRRSDSRWSNPEQDYESVTVSRTDGDIVRDVVRRLQESSA